MSTETKKRKVIDLDAEHNNNNNNTTTIPTPTLTSTNDTQPNKKRKTTQTGDYKKKKKVSDMDGMEKAKHKIELHNKRATKIKEKMRLEETQIERKRSEEATKKYSKNVSIETVPFLFVKNTKELLSKGMDELYGISKFSRSLSNPWNPFINIIPEINPFNTTRRVKRRSTTAPSPINNATTIITKQVVANSNSTSTDINNNNNHKLPSSFKKPTGVANRLALKN